MVHVRTDSNNFICRLAWMYPGLEGGGGVSPGRRICAMIIMCFFVSRREEGEMVGRDGGLWGGISALWASLVRA